MKQYDRGGYRQYRSFQERFRQLVRENAVHRFAVIDQSENCTGDYIFQSKNTTDSFFAFQCQDSRFIYDSLGVVDSYDVYESAYESERQYECYASNFTKYAHGTMVSHECHNLYYTDYCFNSNNLFGCISLKRKEFCILNKQYSREEYESLRERIIEQMKASGEYGEFLPARFSPFAYNESAAQDFMPLAQGEVAQRGLLWKTRSGEAGGYQGPDYEIPDHIRDVKPDIVRAILRCEVSGKYYKIIPQELEFYRTLNVPAPRRCFDERHKARTFWRNPLLLWERKCSRGGCGNIFQTAYAPERPEKVYCESCYQKEIY